MQSTFLAIELLYCDTVICTVKSEIYDSVSIIGIENLKSSNGTITRVTVMVPTAGK